MRIVTALLLASTLVITGQAAAQSTGATLQDLSGKVLVNKGDGLVSGKAGTALVDGDRIVTLDKSGARIVFPDGCGVALEENMIFVVNAQLGCKAVPVASNQPVAPGGLTTPTQGLILGTAYVGGGALIGNTIFNNNRHHDDRPISRQ
jgi:hypothetical protein